jgi:hypothetical protein
MIVIALQEGLPVFGGDGVAGVVNEIQRAFDDGKNDGVFLADHAGRVRGSGNLEDHVPGFRNPAFIVGPRALHGVNDDRSGMEMHLEGGARLGTNEQDDLPGDRIQLDELDEMSFGLRNPGQILRIGVAGECLMNRMSADGVGHDSPPGYTGSRLRAVIGRSTGLRAALT